MTLCLRAPTQIRARVANLGDRMYCPLDDAEVSAAVGRVNVHPVHHAEDYGSCHPRRVTISEKCRNIIEYLPPYAFCVCTRGEQHCMQHLTDLPCDLWMMHMHRLLSEVLVEETTVQSPVVSVPDEG